MNPLIALMGFFVLAGTAHAPVDAEPSPLFGPTAQKVAVKDEVIVRKDVAGELTVKLTAYNAVPEQTDSNPLVTASGAYSNPEVVAARSHDLAGQLPFGTIISIERPAEAQLSCGYDSVEHLLGYRVIADTTHSRKRNQIDVLLDHTNPVTIRGADVNPARALGICDDVVITVVGRISVRDIPRTQVELAEIVGGGRLALTDRSSF